MYNVYIAEICNENASWLSLNSPFTAFTDSYKELESITFIKELLKTAWDCEHPWSDSQSYKPF